MVEAVPCKVKSKDEAVKVWILQPLIEAYELIKGDITPGTHENKITWKLVFNVKHKSSIAKEVYEKHTIDVSCRPKEASDEDTPNESDMKFFIAHTCVMLIEAKRIYEHGTVSDYCGKKGVGRFLSGYYSSEEDNGGMIAYIQKGRIGDVRMNIITKLNEHNCKEIKENIGVDNTFVSIHKRVSNEEIKIYHLLLDFVPN